MILRIEITEGLTKRTVEVYRENDKLMCTTTDANFKDVQLAEDMYKQLEKK